MLLTVLMRPAAGQLGQYKLDINAKSSEGIFVTFLQVRIATFLQSTSKLTLLKQTDGYATISSLAEFNGTIDPEKFPQGLFSLTVCLRYGK